MTPLFPSSGRLAGVDYGTVRIGIALSDARQTLASPHTTYSRKNADTDERWFRQLVDEEQIAGFVVGLPVHLSGAESQKSLETKQFGQWLQQVTGRPVCYYDERFSSVEATEMLTQAKLSRRKKKSQIDRLAAQIILTAFLESPRDGVTGEGISLEGHSASDAHHGQQPTSQDDSRQDPVQHDPSAFRDHP